MTEENRWALPGLVSLGLALRLYGAARAGLTFDESIVWAFAREIRVTPAVHLVSRTADHPLLDAYLVRASSLAFGESDLGLRVLHAGLGSATIVVVYLLAKTLWDRRAGLIAAGLLAVDPFHVSWSRLILEETPLLLCEAGALYFGWRALSRDRGLDFVRAGTCLGLACLAKETALVLFPAFALTLVLDERGRRALRTRGPYLGLLAAIVFVGLDVALGHGPETHWRRAAGILTRPPGLTLKGTSLYLGELFRWVCGSGVLDSDYAEGSAYATAWPLGVLYLLAVLAALRSRDPADRFLVGPFLLVFTAASVVDGRRVFDPFWWASLSFVPAILLSGWLVGRAWPCVPATAPLLAAALVTLAVYDASWLGRPGKSTPRLTRREWSARIAADGEQRAARGDLATARDQAEQALLLDPDNRAARALLARLP